MPYNVVSTKRKIFFFFIFVLCTLFTRIYTPHVKASGFDLSVTPSIFEIELTPPAQATAKQTLSLENNSNDVLPLRILYQPFKPHGDNGQIEYLSDGQIGGNDPKIFAKVQLLQNNQPVNAITLPPKTKRTFDLAVSVPKDEPPGDYYFSLIFASDTGDTTQDQSSISHATAGIAVNVLLSIGPKSATTGFVQEFSTPFLQNQGPVPFVVKIKNTSTHFIYPKAQIVITNMFGQSIGKVDLLPVNILANSSRDLPSKEQFVFAANANTTNSQQVAQIQQTAQLGQKALAIWPEQFLLGPYTATLTVALSDQGPLYKQSIHFLALPVYLIAGLLICLLLITLIAKRLRIRNVRNRE